MSRRVACDCRIENDYFELTQLLEQHIAARAAAAAASGGGAKSPSKLSSSGKISKRNKN
jgi:hypothetical protein